jgi:signal transduction histidine kinase
MNERFLTVISKFSDAGTRLEGATELATFMGAKAVLCFFFDPVVQSYLPAPGFPQTLVNAKGWHKFLKVAEPGAYQQNKISLQENLEENITSLYAENGCVMVLMGVKQNSESIKHLQKIFALVASVIESEVTNLDLRSRMKTAEQSSRKSEQLTKSLDQARSKLQQALKTEEEFLSIASHELKTPITSINAFIQVLLQLYPDEKDAQTNYILTRTKFQIDRLIDLVSDLLDVTKIQSGNLNLDLGELYLDAIVDEVIQDYLPTFTSQEIIKTGVTKSKIVCDKSRIGQVVSNLLTNAVKYSVGSKKIVVTVHEDEGNVQVDIQDFGIGIAAESIPKIFGRFYRAHSADSGRFSSLGLGLFICADIIKRHNGKIWVDSEPGIGSSFHFSLPKNSNFYQ